MTTTSGGILKEPDSKERATAQTLRPTGSARPAQVYLALGATAVGLYFLLAPAVQSFFFEVVGMSAVAMIVVAVRWHRPATPMAWYSIAAGFAMFAIGDLIWTFYEGSLGRDPSFPSLGDTAHLLGYIPLALGLILIVRARRPGADRASFIDAAIITVAGAAAMWIFLIAPNVTQNNGIDLSHLVSFAYPVADLMLLALAAGVAFSRHTPSVSLRIIGAALLARIIADAQFALASLDGRYETGHPIDAGWLLAYVFIGTAALHPSMKLLTEPGKKPLEMPLSQVRVVALGAAALAVPFILLLQNLRGEPLHVPVIVGGSVLITGLVVVRMVDLVGALQEAALHDPLTGLPNRRLLDDRLAQVLRRAERSRAPVAVLFLDLAGFKAINDRFGHETGDAALIEVGRRLTAVVRKSDTVARLGGDEFVIVCEGTDEIEARSLAERVRSTVAVPLPTHEAVIRLRADVGIAVEHVRGSAQVRDLLEAADRAMYSAKASLEDEGSSET